MKVKQIGRAEAIFDARVTWSSSAEGTCRLYEFTRKTPAKRLCLVAIPVLDESLWLLNRSKIVSATNGL